MLRLRSLQYQQFYFISPLENSFNEFLKGKNISPSTVSSFICDKKPEINTVHDYVFLHRLATQNCLALTPSIQRTLGDAITLLDVTQIPTNPLSVLLSCSSELDDDLVSSRKILDEICSRQESWSPAIVVRVLRALAKDPSSPWNEKLDTILSDMDLGDLSMDDILVLLKSPNRDLYVRGIDRIAQIAPLITPEESVIILVELASRNPPSNSVLPLVTDLKRNILSAENLSPRLIARAITALARIGALTSQFRGIVTKAKLASLPESEMSVLRVAVYTANPPNVEDEVQKFDAKFLRAINKQKPVLSIQDVYTGIARGGSEILSDESTRSMYEKIGKKFENLKCTDENFHEFTMFVESSVLIADAVVPPEFVSYETSRLGEDPFVQEVMKFFEVENFSPMSDKCALPVIKHVNDTVIDIDSFENPLTRFVRSKIAEKLGLKYRIIDPLSWYAASNKEEYMQNICENDSAFSCDCAVQTGADLRHDPERPKAPFFGYIRKIDLK